MTNIDLLNEYYHMYESTKDFAYTLKHNKVLNNLSKNELKKAYRFRFGQLNLDTTEEMRFKKENYKERLRL